MKIFLSATVMILLGAGFIYLSYYMYDTLRVKYHESAPEALGITGAVIVLFGILGYFQRQAYKEGNFWRWFVLLELSDGIFKLF